jgi:hypothetical protein
MSRVGINLAISNSASYASCQISVPGLPSTPMGYAVHVDTQSGNVTASTGVLVVKPFGIYLIIIGGRQVMTL